MNQENPIAYYEELLQSAVDNGLSMSRHDCCELIAMVKARNAEIKTFQRSCSLVYENVILQTQLDHQLCVTRTLEKEIEELRLDAERYRYGGCLFKTTHDGQYAVTAQYDRGIDDAIASQQGGEVK